jgi:hypothetical protein
MKRILTGLLALVLCIGTVFCAKAESLLMYQSGPNEESEKHFKKGHPNVQLIQTDNEEHDYQTTAQFIGALITHTFVPDIFALYSGFIDSKQVMAKGYCLDLSGSDIIRAEIEKMHPNIASQVMVDGKIMAVPQGLWFELFVCDETVWEEAGFTKEDVPQTYPAFLDFLEGWVSRIANEPEANIAINTMWDEVLYNEYRYAEWLIELLMENYILQSQYAGEALRFDENTLKPLIERAIEIGRELYHYDPAHKGTKQLFQEMSGFIWRGMPEGNALSFRLAEEQPNVIGASLRTIAANPAGQNQTATIELLESIILFPDESGRSFLYADAEPTRNPNFDDELVHWQNMIERVQKKLADPKFDFGFDDYDDYTQKDWEVLLVRFERNLADVMEREYSFSPEKLAEYKSFANALYFAAPSIFLNTAEKEGREVRQMQARLAAGQMSVEQFLSEMNRMAKVMEMEAQ